MCKNLSKEQVEKIRMKYPAGTKIVCYNMKDPYNPIPKGTRGSVSFVDDAGTIHMNWENGSCLGLIYGVDSFGIVK